MDLAHRERYNQQTDGDEMAQDTMNVATNGKKSKIHVTDNLQWVLLNQQHRGDLVAAYDPGKPDAFADDASALNRELEIAKDRAGAQRRVARPKHKNAEEEAAKRILEAEQIAQANQRNLSQAQKHSLRRRRTR